MKMTGEAAFESIIETHLLENGYVSVEGERFDRDRTFFPSAVLAFIRSQAALHQRVRLKFPQVAETKPFAFICATACGTNSVRFGRFKKSPAPRSAGFSGQTKSSIPSGRAKELCGCPFL